MRLAMRYRGTCTVCGMRLRGIRVESGRVNKASIRTDGRGLVFVDRDCPECRTPNHDTSGPWALDEESAARVKAARERKGWA